MNENINLVDILKDCPQGTKLYSTVFGEVKFDRIDTILSHPIVVRIGRIEDDHTETFAADGRLYSYHNGECVLFPSKEERNWSKFNQQPQTKQPKFDPKTLQPFDKVLVRNCTADKWKCAHFSYMEPSFKGTIYVTSMLFRDRILYNDNCIPYNDETKHLVGTTDEAPEFYRYWED